MFLNKTDQAVEVSFLPVNTGSGLISFKLLNIISKFLLYLPTFGCNMGTGGTEAKLENVLQVQKSYFPASQEQLRTGSTSYNIDIIWTRVNENSVDLLI